MNRLLQGDVGSGKTVVTVALCHSAIVSGTQAAFMAPTEIPARQHYEAMRHFSEPFHLNVALLTGSTPMAERRELFPQLKEGSVHLLVGAHALLDETVEFQQLGLAVADGQYRSGVTQRVAPTQKGDHPHILAMSATPIPRTLVLMIYGDLGLLVLDELPPG